MGCSTRDVVPVTQVRANLSNLTDQAKAGAEKIITTNGESYVTLIEDAKRGLADIEAGRTVGADDAITQLQQRRAGTAMGNTAKKRD